MQNTKENVLKIELELNPAINKQPPKYSITDYAKAYHTTPQCAASVLGFYAENEHTVESYRGLSAGTDIWQRKESHELKEIIGVSKSAAVMQNLNDPKMIINCMQWICRGLSVADAIRKAMVDKYAK